MKRLKLSADESRTLRDMGIYFPHARTRMRAQGILWLSHGMTLQQVAHEFEVHINSVEHWWQRWNRIGLMGLYEGHHSGRPPKLSTQQQKTLCELADEEGGTANALRCQWCESPERVQISNFTLKRYLRRIGFRYKRCRLSLKGKRDQDAFERAQGVLASLQTMAKEGQCDLLSFDESGFSPNPPVQYGWTRIGQTRCAESGSHNQRVNVLGALRQNNELIWSAQERRTVRDDVIAFFDQIAEQAHPVPCIVLLDNARIHKGEVMEEKRRQWEQKGLYLYYLPPYSPELNRIEILWKQAKYFWRKFTRLTGDDLIDEVHSMMKNYGKKFTINFA